MDGLPTGWLTVIALTAAGIVVGGGLALVDETVVGSGLTGTPIVLLGGLATLVAALAASEDSPLTDS